LALFTLLLVVKILFENGGEAVALQQSNSLCDLLAVLGNLLQINKYRNIVACNMQRVINFKSPSLAVVA